MEENQTPIEVAECEKTNAEEKHSKKKIIILVAIGTVAVALVTAIALFFAINTSIKNSIILKIENKYLVDAATEAEKLGPLGKVYVKASVEESVLEFVRSHSYESYDNKNVVAAQDVCRDYEGLKKILTNVGITEDDKGLLNYINAILALKIYTENYNALDLIVAIYEDLIDGMKSINSAESYSNSYNNSTYYSSYTSSYYRLASIYLEDGKDKITSAYKAAEDKTGDEIVFINLKGAIEDLYKAVYTSTALSINSSSIQKAYDDFADTAKTVFDSLEEGEEQVKNLPELP